MRNRSFSFRHPRASTTRHIRFVSAIFAGCILLSAISVWANPLRRIVEFQASTPVAAQQQIIASSNSNLLRLLPLIHSASIVLPEDAPEEALAALTAAVEVVAVHADVALNAQRRFSGEGSESIRIAQTASPSPGWSWNLQMIERDQLDIASPGAGIHVAVVDTGIDATHPALAGRVVGGYNAVTTTTATTRAQAEGGEAEGGEAEGGEAEGGEAEGGEAEGGENVTPGYADCNGHGTHVAGIIAADTVGVASDVQLHAVRVLNCHGGGFVSDLIDGLSWVYDQPEIRVVNMSLGFYKEGSYPLLHQAIKTLYNAGVVLVSAAGNYRYDCFYENEGQKHFLITAEGCNTRVKFPARYPESIAVAASDANDQIGHYSIHGPEVDVTAPGGTALTPVVSTLSDITANSCNSSASAEGGEAEGGEAEGGEAEGGETSMCEAEGGEAEGGEAEGGEAEGGEAEGGEIGIYGVSSGTSMAAPHVTGIVALMLGEVPDLAPHAVEAILKKTAKKISGSYSAQGHGRVDAVKAIKEALKWKEKKAKNKDTVKIGKDVLIPDSVILDENVDIGDDSVIGAESHLMAKAHVKKSVTLGKSVTIGEKTKIEDHAVVGDNVSFGRSAVIKKYAQIGHEGDATYGTMIGDETVIEEYATIGNNVSTGQKSRVKKYARIGDHSMLGDHTVIEQDVILDTNVVIGNYSKVKQETHIMSYTIIGNYTNIDKEVTIGEHVSIGDSSTIKKKSNIGNDVIIGDNVKIEEEVTICAGEIIDNDLVIPKNVTVGTCHAD